MIDKTDKLIPYKTFIKKGIFFFSISVILVIIHKWILDYVVGYALLITVVPYSIVWFFALKNVIKWFNLIHNDKVRVFLLVSNWREQVKTIPTSLLLSFLNMGQLLFLFSIWLSFLHRI